MNTKRLRYFKRWTYTDKVTTLYLYREGELSFFRQIDRLLRNYANVRAKRDSNIVPKSIKLN